MSLSAAILAGLLVPYGLQPGGEVKAEFTLVQPTEQVALVATVRGGAFARPDHFVRGLVGAEFGFTVNPDRPLRFTLAGGAAYLPTAKIDRVSIDLASGNRTTHFEAEHIGLVHGAVTLTHMPVDLVGWYLNITVGSTATGAPPSDALFYSVGLGVRFAVEAP